MPLETVARALEFSGIKAATPPKSTSVRPARVRRCESVIEFLLCIVTLLVIYAS